MLKNNLLNDMKRKFIGGIKKKAKETEAKLAELQTSGVNISEPFINLINDTNAAITATHAATESREIRIPYDNFCSRYDVILNTLGGDMEAKESDHTVAIRM